MLALYILLSIVGYMLTGNLLFRQILSANANATPTEQLSAPRYIERFLLARSEIYNWEGRVLPNQDDIIEDTWLMMFFWPIPLAYILVVNACIAPIHFMLKPLHRFVRFYPEPSSAKNEIVTAHPIPTTEAPHPFDKQIEPIRNFLNKDFGSNHSRLGQSLASLAQEQSVVEQQIVHWKSLREQAINLGLATTTFDARIQLLEYSLTELQKNIAQHKTVLEGMNRYKTELGFKLQVLEAYRSSDEILERIHGKLAIESEFSSALIEAEELVKACREMFALEREYIARQPGAELALLNAHGTEEEATISAIPLRLVQGAKND